MNSEINQHDIEVHSAQKAMNDTNDDHSVCDQDDEIPSIFRTVLKQLQLDRVLLLCAIIRQKQCGATRPSPSFIPTVGEERFYGSFNIVIPIHFEDGICWMLKVPANGTPVYFDKTASATLTAEARTMQFLKKNTTIPIPEVFAFDASLTNGIGCPFILMEKMSGTQLHKVWFDESCTREQRQLRRERALKDIAHAMAQLRNFTFDKAGLVEYDGSGNISGVGPSRTMDLVGLKEYHENLHKRKQSGLADIDEEEDETPYKLVGPWSTEQEFYHQYLPMRISNRQRLLHKYLPLLRTEGEPKQARDRGMHRLLHKLVQCIPASKEDHPFVLGHPDFGLQNFLVSAEDGSLQAIIDWNGVQAVPRSLGYASYPNWLMEDWNDESFYESPIEEQAEQSADDTVLDAPVQDDTEDSQVAVNADTEMQGSTHHTSKSSSQNSTISSFEDSPNVLAASRALYKHYLQDAVASNEPGSKPFQTEAISATDTSRSTEASHYVKNLMDNMESICLPTQLCKKFLKEIENVLGIPPPYEDFYTIQDLQESIRCEGLDSETESYLKQGMAALFGVDAADHASVKKSGLVERCRTVLRPLKRKYVETVKEYRGKVCRKIRQHRTTKRRKQLAKAAEEKAKRDRQLEADQDTSL